MLRNYFKIALRNLLRHKLYTAINITGLAMGIAFCLLIILFVKDEWRYDTFHPKADRIYCVALKEITGDGRGSCSLLCNATMITGFCLYRKCKYMDVPAGGWYGFVYRIAYSELPGDESCLG